MNPLLPDSERDWWYDTTYPQYTEDALIKSRYYVEHRDDPNVLDYIEDSIDPILNENAYDELVDGTSNVSMDTWVTGTNTGEYNNIYRTGNSVTYLNRKKDVPIRQIVENEVDDARFVKEFNEHILPDSPSRYDGRNGMSSPRSNGRMSPRRNERNGVSSPRRDERNGVSSPRRNERNGVSSPRRDERNGVSSPRRNERNGVSSPRRDGQNNRYSPRSNGRDSVSNLRYNGRLSPRRNGRNVVSSPRSNGRNGRNGQNGNVNTRSADSETMLDTKLIGISPVNLQGRDMSPRRSSWVVHDSPLYSSTLSNYGSTSDSIVANLGNIDREYNEPSTSQRYVTIDRSVATGNEDVDSIVRLIDNMSNRMTNRTTVYNVNGSPVNGVINGNRQLTSNDLYFRDRDGQVEIVYRETGRSLLNQ